MNTCPNFGKMAGLHGSILQGCMCQYSMQAQPQRTWQGLTDEEVHALWMTGEVNISEEAHSVIAYEVEAKLKQKNGFAEEKNT